jgi:hypothetical protein
MQHGAPVFLLPPLGEGRDGGHPTLNKTAHIPTPAGPHPCGPLASSPPEGEGAKT